MISIIHLLDFADHQRTLLLIIVSINKPVSVIYQLGHAREASYSLVGFPAIKIDFLSVLNPPNTAKLAMNDK